jgi:ankyrin repeat protein
LARIQLLLKKGASLSALDDYGYSALLYAFYSPNAQELVPALIAAGADPLVVGNNGYTALMMAAQLYGVELIPSLIKARVPINAVDDEGKTALMYACINADTSKAVEYLLDAGADKTIIDEMGYTAYDYLMENSNLYDGPLASRLEVSR